MKKLALLSICGIILLSVTACNTTKPELISQQLVFVEIPSELYNCPDRVRYPNPDTLTDQQVSETMVRLARNNELCSNSIKSIKQHQVEMKEFINN